MSLTRDREAVEVITTATSTYVPVRNFPTLYVKHVNGSLTWINPNDVRAKPLKRWASRDNWRKVKT